MNGNTSAQQDRSQTESPPARTFCTFHLQGGLFGIDALAVKEITVMPPLTPIPHAPPAVRGYVNLRGHIVLVLDGNCLLNHGQASFGPGTRLIVFRAHLGDPFGILVDRIGDIVELSDERIERNEAGGIDREGRGDSPSQENLISGVGKIGESLLTILDAAKFLPHIDAVIEQYHKKAYH
jgi:purine-binding chemotaxis protein CheW